MFDVRVTIHKIRVSVRLGLEFCLLVIIKTLLIFSEIAKHNIMVASREGGLGHMVKSLRSYSYC